MKQFFLVNKLNINQNCGSGIACNDAIGLSCVNKTCQCNKNSYHDGKECGI